MPVGSMPYLTRKRAILADRSLELLEEFGLGDDLLHAAFEDPELLGDFPHRDSLGGLGRHHPRGGPRASTQ